MKRLGGPLIVGGAVVWTLGVAAWVSGVWVTLPPDAVKFLVLSLSAVSGGALVVTGAFLRRDGQRKAAAALEGAVPGSASRLIRAPYPQGEMRTRDAEAAAVHAAHKRE